MNKMYTKNVDPRWEALRLAVMEPFERAPRGLPHCNCLGANRAFFGAGVLETAQESKHDAYMMVPTGVKKDGTCTHCGYHACNQPEVSREVLAELRSRLAVTSKRTQAGKFAVVGRNAATGEELRFPSANHAYRAGHATVIQSLKANKAVKGWKWERT